MLFRTYDTTHELIDLDIAWAPYEPGSPQECVVFYWKRKRAIASDATGEAWTKTLAQKHSTANTGSCIPMDRYAWIRDR